MKGGKNQVTVLVADDDLEDCEMIKDAFNEVHLLNPLEFVHDGHELMKTLIQKANASTENQGQLPGLIILDLNMPKMDGREAILKIKTDDRFKRIPLVVLTTSEAEEDIYRTYNLGVNSFVTKPVTFQGLVQVLRDIGHYWLEIVELPAESRRLKL